MQVKTTGRIYLNKTCLLRPICTNRCHRGLLDVGKRIYGQEPSTCMYRTDAKPRYQVAFLIESGVNPEILMLDRGILFRPTLVSFRSV